MLIPEYIVDRVVFATFIKDRSNFQERFKLLRLTIIEYLSSIESGFVSNNSQDFKSFLESKLGPVEFAKPFAIRIRSGSVRLFVCGKEIKGG